MVFIRAPKIERVGPGVEVIATEGNDPVLVRKGKTLAATFHPELSDDRRIHQYFSGLGGEWIDPYRLKPIGWRVLTAGLKPCPFKAVLQATYSGML